jgi:hypothetical protein
MTLYEPYSRNRCPHCSTFVKFEEPKVRPGQGQGQFRESTFLVDNKGIDSNDHISLVVASCPNCRKTIVNLDVVEFTDGQYETIEQLVVYPLVSGRSPVPPEVPENITRDYNEAALVLPFSPKASAALSRRCLQTLLRNAGGTKSKDLDKQIDEVLPHLPAYIGENLDAVRHIGNFAAHEQKSTTTGVVLDVEPGEAEWNLDILEALFDFYYVKPEVERKKREEINKKLQEAGKPKLKDPKGLTN